MKVTLQLYDRARAAVAARGFDADVQTKIALFLGAAKTINAMIMAGFALQPQVSVASPFVHGQYSREMEFATLLARVTRWSSNPVVYVEGAQVVTPLWQAWMQLSTDGSAHGGYSALALGHALLARVRLAPLLPADADESDPFVIALRRIEQEGGRMIQTQIRLLKDGAGNLGDDECERLIEAKQASVDEAFARFLEWLAGDDVGATSPDPMAAFALFPGAAAQLPFMGATNDLMQSLAAGFGWLAPAAARGRPTK